MTTTLTTPTEVVAVHVQETPELVNGKLVAPREMMELVRKGRQAQARRDAAEAALDTVKTQLDAALVAAEVAGAIDPKTRKSVAWISTYDRETISVTALEQERPDLLAKLREAGLVKSTPVRSVTIR